MRGVCVHAHAGMYLLLLCLYAMELLGTYTNQGAQNITSWLALLGEVLDCYDTMPVLLCNIACQFGH